MLDHRDMQLLKPLVVKGIDQYADLTLAFYDIYEIPNDKTVFKKILHKEDIIKHLRRLADDDIIRYEIGAGNSNDEWIKNPGIRAAITSKGLKSYQEEELRLAKVAPAPSKNSRTEIASWWAAIVGLLIAIAAYFIPWSEVRGLFSKGRAGQKTDTLNRTTRPSSFQTKARDSSANRK